MSKIKLSDTVLTKIDVLRALATGIQNVPIELKNGDVVYPVDTKQSGNILTIECTDGSKISLTVNVH